MDARWLYLTPAQWAGAHSHQQCVDACIEGGGKPEAVRVGRGGTNGAAVSTNRLHPAPAKQPRRRRGSASTKAPVTDAGESNARWGGHEWVRRSVLAVLLTRGSAAAKELKEQYPCLKGLAAALRLCLNNNQPGSPALPVSTVASVSLRPAIQLRRADPNPDLHKRVTAQRCTLELCSLKSP